VYLRLSSTRTLGYWSCRVGLGESMGGSGGVATALLMMLVCITYGFPARTSSGSRFSMTADLCGDAPSDRSQSNVDNRIDNEGGGWSGVGGTGGNT